MKIAILSDIHDNIWNLEKVLKQIKEKKLEVIIFCGDLCAPFTAGILGSAGIPVHACLGNVDEDHIMMQKLAGDNVKWTGLAPEYGEVIFNKRKVAYCHYPKLAELLAKSGDFDAVFHGHTHEARNKKYGKAILVNPGAVCGIQDARPGAATYAIYDTKTNSAEILEI
jgi:putative phosphoesterase